VLVQRLETGITGLAGLAAGIGVYSEQMWLVSKSEGRVGYLARDADCEMTQQEKSRGYSLSGHCDNMLKDGDEADVDCGGLGCPRCRPYFRCSFDAECQNDQCIDGYCGLTAFEQNEENFLSDYLDTDFYRASFAHHLQHGDMGAASYANPYPIMAESFCDTVGMVDGVLDCGIIDKDSLLLGNCWCHPCLPEDPCQNDGTCVNYMRQGYTCDCSTAHGFTGDHCHIPPVTCGDVMAFWDENECCGPTTDVISGGEERVAQVVNDFAAQAGLMPSTCRTVKRLYKDNECCSMEDSKLVSIVT